MSTCKMLEIDYAELKGVVIPTHKHKFWQNENFDISVISVKDQNHLDKYKWPKTCVQINTNQPMSVKHNRR